METSFITGKASLVNMTRFMIEDKKEKMTQEERHNITRTLLYFENILKGYQFYIEGSYVTPLKPSLNAYKSLETRL